MDTFFEGQPVLLVGRATEFRGLISTWDVREFGVPSTVLVGGKSGLGKSRLVQEFCKAWLCVKEQLILYGRVTSGHATGLWRLFAGR